MVEKSFRITLQSPLQQPIVAFAGTVESDGADKYIIRGSFEVLDKQSVGSSIALGYGPTSLSWKYATRSSDFNVGDGHSVEIKEDRPNGDRIDLRVGSDSGPMWTWQYTDKLSIDIDRETQSGPTDWF